MVSIPRGLTRNSFWMVLARFGAQGLTVIFTVVLARRLGSAGFGEYAFIASLVFVANSLTTFGTDMVLIREIAARDDLSGLSASLILQLALSSLLIAAVWFFGAGIPHQSTHALLALRIYVLSLIPLAFFTVFTTALRGKQRLDAYAILSLLIPALQAGLVWLPGLDLAALCALLAGIQLIAAVVAGWLCTRLIPGFWHARIASSRGLLLLVRSCAPLALLTVLGMTYQRLGVYMLSMLTNPTDTGLFSAAARALEASKTAHLAVFAALYPALALARNPQLQARGLLRSIRLSRNALLAGAAAGAILLFAFADPIVSLLYGAEYRSAAPILRILSLTLVPFTVNSYLTLSFVASRRELVVGRALAASLLAALLLNLWWVPRWGPEGSAWAALVAECLQAAVLLVGMQRHMAVEGAVRDVPTLPGQI